MTINDEYAERLRGLMQDHPKLIELAQTQPHVNRALQYYLMGQMSLEDMLVLALLASNAALDEVRKMLHKTIGQLAPKGFIPQ